jgi:hypothetical protein
MSLTVTEKIESMERILFLEGEESDCFTAVTLEKLEQLIAVERLADEDYHPGHIYYDQIEKTLADICQFLQENPGFLLGGKITDSGELIFDEIRYFGPFCFPKWQKFVDKFRHADDFLFESEELYAWWGA